MKPYVQARRVIALALSLCLIATSEGMAFAQGLVFEKTSNISDGMSQIPLSEKKIYDLQKYLLQNRSPLGTSTLLEAGSGSGFRELDSTLLKNSGVTSSGMTNYSFSYGKALYDGNIAIIDLPTTNSGRYTYEAPYYCDLLIASLAKFKKIGNNICLPNYATFKTEYDKNPERTYVNVIKTSEIKDADLSKYGTIIFPDIILGRHPEILDDFGTEGIAKIRSFVENGGVAFFSSKSLILADKMELTNRVIDDNILIKHHENQGKILLQSSSDFNTQVLNQGFYEGKNYLSKTGSGYYEYLLGSYYVKPGSDLSIVPVRFFDVAHDGNYYFQDVSTSEDAPLDIESAISAFYKPVGHGLVVYNGGNSLFSPQNNSHKLFINHTLNSITLSFLREVHASAKVAQKSNPEVRENLVPALERNLVFEYSMDAANVFNGNVTNLTATIDMSTGGLLLDSTLPSDCQIGSSSGQLVCTRPNLAAGVRWTLKFGLKVDEPTFTQKGLGIVVTRTTLDYTDSNDAQIHQNMGAQTIDAVESANMRTSLNIDPAGYYPLPGEGVYIDQVLNAENKAATEANDIDYTVSVPLLSPLFEESDQSRLISRIVFSKDYHNNLYNPATKTNYYPFKNEGDCAVTDLVLPNRCKDYVIPKLASGSVDYMPGTNKYQYVDNYDEPVYRANTDADEAYANINTGILSPDLGKNIMRQSFMPDADILFRKASPRRMVFEYPVKKELLFARQDVYFYNNPAFPLPHGITGVNQYISMDKYGNCTKEEGKYGYPDGVIAGKYPNSIACNASGALLPWINEKIDYDHLPAGMSQTEYLFPIDPKNNISGPEMLDGFDSDGNYIGQKDQDGNQSEAYPIKFIRGSYASFYLPPRSTPKGGYMEFTLPDGVNPSKVYVLADHIAINKIETIGQTTKVYFYRGKLPNEQSLKSIIGIALEGVNQDISDIALKVYSLTYDLSAENSNRYDFEQTISTSFAKHDFFKLPAVKMTFTLPRRKRIKDTDLLPLNLTEGQTNALFTVPEYYSHSLVFKSATLPALTTLMTQATLTDEQKTGITDIFTSTIPESYVRKYENLEPMVRFGTYIQELAFHRTVWGVAEDHPIRDPGIMADSAMFGNVGTLGISPIPFREYLTTGASQIIPLATENARVDYKDIFGRQFAAPIRTVVPEAVPLPPPVRNFMMNTTYEMYDKDGVKHQTWDGESEYEIRENIKLYNNYPRYFDPTTCNDNPSSPAYGTCWDGTGSTVTGYNGQTDYLLSDKILDSIDNYWIRNVRLFDTKSAYDAFMAGLQDQLTASGLTNYSVPTLHRAENGKGNINLATGEFIDDKARNYSPEVENYFPKNYVDNNMWNLTHFDYDDSVYSKGYPYHMDNQLPNPHAEEFWNPAKYLPHNILAIPVNRGIGYKTKYFSEEPSYLQYETQNYGKIENNITPYTSWKYAGRKGWWPENLQNRDVTLLAGQDEVNQIPYAYNGGDYLKSPLITRSDFDIAATSNIYSCLFNPVSLIDKPGKYQYRPNSIVNNVIPMIPWIQKENENANYLKDYGCNIGDFINTYSDENKLSKINNIVETEDAFWLYFASNLRGEAKEALNIISRLSPFPGAALHEGDTKIIEGGRFVYWNPAFGPNAFEIVDNPVSVVKSVNSDITVDKELLPYTLKNYKTDAYLLYTVKDPGELFVDSHGVETARNWKDEVYIDSRGNGNYGASVYVGASYNKAATKSLLDPGDKTLIRLDIYNNSGYDWAMLGTGTVANTNNNQYVTYVNGGIDFTIQGNQALNANDLITKVARNVLKPDRYNFLNIEIPSEIKPYVTVTPSDANILTPGTFFDFDFVNVTTIRDGFKGSYFLDLAIDPSIPDTLRAKIYDIKLSINPEYFNHIPGVSGKDPVNWPDTLDLPPMKFAIADANNNAFYRSGYSTGVSLDIAYESGFTLDTAYELTEEGVTEMRLAAGDGTNKHRRLRETFENLTASGFALRTFTGSVTASGSDSVAHLDFSSAGIDEFPYVNASGSIIPKTYVLVHLKRDELSDGEHMVVDTDNVNFTNFAGKIKTKTNTIPLKGYAQGPKLDIWYRSALIGNTKNDQLEVQKLTEGENTIEVKLFLKNIGTDVAFDPTMTVNVAPGVTVDQNLTGNASFSGNQVIIRNLYSESGALGTEGEAVGPGITNYFPIYLTYSGTYQDTPVSLVNSAEYVFTPYDPILPALSGSYSTGFTLDYIKTESILDRQGVDEGVLTLSGNTLGVYWDATLDGSGILDKSTNTDSEVLVQYLNFDPLKEHTISTTSSYRTKNNDYKTIKSEILTATGKEATLDSDGYTVNDASANFAFSTNALGKYGYSFSWVGTQGSGSIMTGSILVPDSGDIHLQLDNIDVMATLNLTGSVSDASGTLLKEVTVKLPLVGARIYDQVSRRTGEHTRVQFRTNYLVDTCFDIARDGLTVLSCRDITSGPNVFEDVNADPYRDHAYRITVYSKADRSASISADVFYISAPDTSSIPLKIIPTAELHDAIAFGKVKDLIDNYLVNETLIRYIVRMKTDNAPYLSQYSDDENIEIRYASGQTIYAGDSWDKILALPELLAKTSLPGLDGYTPTFGVEAGDSDTLFVFENYNLILLKNVWSKPAKVVMYHASAIKELPECINSSKPTESCWFYDMNKIGVYTKKFSKFVLYDKRVASSGGGIMLRVDACPNGDNSPSYYDGLCDPKQDSRLTKSPDLLKEVTPEQQSLFDTYDFTTLKPLDREIRAYIELRYITRINTAIARKTDNLSNKIQIYRKIVNYLDARIRRGGLSTRDERVFGYIRIQFVRAIHKFEAGILAKN